MHSYKLFVLFVSIFFILLIYATEKGDEIKIRKQVIGREARIVSIVAEENQIADDIREYLGATKSQRANETSEHRPHRESESIGAG